MSYGRASYSRVPYARLVIPARGSATSLALAARALAFARGLGAVTGAAAIAARALASARGPAALTGAAAVSGHAAAALTMRGAAAGTLALGARGLAASRGAGPLVFATFLAARSFAASRTSGAIAGALAVAGRGTPIARGGGAMRGAASAAARALATLSGRLGLRIAGLLDQTPRYTALAAALSYVGAVAPLRFTAIAPASDYIAVIPGNAMPAIKDLPPIAPNQVETITCDFGAFLPPGVMLVGAPTVSVVKDLAGKDLNPTHILNGSPIIGTAARAPGSGVVNAAVLQQVKGGVDGAVYVIEITCSRSDGSPVSNVAEGYFHLPCVAPQ